MFWKPRKDARASLNPEKIRLIDIAFGELGCRSFVDFGGAWGVEAGYTFYTLETYGPGRGCLIDTHGTPAIERRARAFPALTFLKKDFAAPSLPEEIGSVDAIYFFDVLLHQVSPDWDRILSRFSGVARYFMIFNQQWVNGAATVRLLDLGEEEYFRNVPHTPDDPTYREVLSRPSLRLDDYRTYRDCPAIWQWGITDEDLIGTMRGLNFTMLYYKDCGRCFNLPHFRNRAFIFARR